MKSLFKEMGGTHRRVYDYFIPNLALPDTGNYQIGKYGRMRCAYPRNHKLASPPYHFAVGLIRDALGAACPTFPLAMTIADRIREQ